MEDTVTLSRADFDWCIKLYAAVLEWKSARLSLQMIQNQGEPEEKIAEAAQYLRDCERALSVTSQSSIGRHLLMGAMGLEAAGGTESA